MNVSVIEEALTINTSATATPQQRNEAISILESYQSDTSLIFNTVAELVSASQSPQLRHFGLSSFTQLIKRCAGSLDQDLASKLIFTLIQLYAQISDSDPRYIQETYATAFAEMALCSWETFWGSLSQDILALFNSTNTNLTFNIVSETVEALSEKLTTHVTKDSRKKLIAFLSSLARDCSSFIYSSLSSDNVALVSACLRSLLAFIQFISPLFIENNQLHTLLVQNLCMNDFYVRSTACRILGECNRSQESTTLNALILCDISHKMSEGRIIEPCATTLETHDYFVELCNTLSSLFSTLPGNYLHSDLPDNSLNILFNFIVWLGKEHPSPLIFEASISFLSTVSRDEVLAKRVLGISSQIINDIFILCYLNFARRGEPSNLDDPATDFMATKIQDTPEYISWYSGFKQSVVDLTKSMSGFFPRIALTACGYKLHEALTKIAANEYTVNPGSSTVDQNDPVYKEFVQASSFTQSCVEGIVARSAMLIGVTKSDWKKSFIFHDRDPFTGEVVGLFDQILAMVLSHQLTDASLLIEQISLVKSFTVYFIRCPNLFDKTLLYILNNIMFRMPSEKNLYSKMLSNETLSARRLAVKTFINLCDDCPNFISNHVQQISSQINEAYKTQAVTEHEHEQVLFGLAVVILNYEHESGTQLIEQLFQHHISVLGPLLSCTDINSLCTTLGYGLDPVPEQIWNLRRSIYYALEGLNNLFALSKKTTYKYLDQTASIVLPTILNFTSLLLNLYSQVNHPILSLCIDEISRVMGRFSNADVDKSVSSIETDSKYLAQWSLDCLRNGLSCLGSLSSSLFMDISSFAATLPALTSRIPIWVLRYVVRDFIIPYFGYSTLNGSFEPILTLLQPCIFRIFGEYAAARERLKIKEESSSGLADEVFIDKVLAEVTTEVSKAFSAVMGCLKKDNIAKREDFVALWSQPSPSRAIFLELISAILSVPSASPAKHIIQPIRLNIDIFKTLSTEQEINAALQIWSSLLENMQLGFCNDVPSEAISLMIQYYTVLANVGLTEKLSYAFLDLPSASMALFEQFNNSVLNEPGRTSKPQVTRILAECGVQLNIKQKTSIKNCSALAFNPQSRVAERILSQQNSWTATEGDLGLSALYY